MNSTDFDSWDYSDCVQADGRYVVDYVVDNPTCSACHSRNLTLNSKRKRRVTEIVDDNCDHPEIVELDLNILRYKCRDCGKTVEAYPQTVFQNHKATKRLEKWVVKQSIFHSPAEISAMTGGKMSKNNIWDIFNRWIQQEEAIYWEHTVAPELLGLHVLRCFEQRYVLITDLANKTVLEILPAGDIRLQRYLETLSNGNVKQIYTDISFETLFPAKAIFRDVKIIILKNSILEAYTEALLSAFDELYTGPNRNKVRRVLEIPLIQQRSTWDDDPVVPDTIRYAKAKLKGTALYRVLECQQLLSQCIQHNWTKDAYDHWLKMLLTEIPAIVKFKNSLHIFDQEIQASFFWDPNISILKQVIRTIEDNSNCKFSVLRARIIYSMPVQAQTTAQWQFVGIPAEHILSVLPGYPPLPL